MPGAQITAEDQNVELGLIKLAQECDKLYEEYAIARGEYEALKNNKDNVFALIVQKQDESSVSAKREAAYATDEYREFVSGLNEAEKQFRIADAKVKAAEMKLACYQSINKRASAEIALGSFNP